MPNLVKGLRNIKSNCSGFITSIERPIYTFRKDSQFIISGFVRTEIVQKQKTVGYLKIDEEIPNDD